MQVPTSVLNGIPLELATGKTGDQLWINQTSYIDANKMFQNQSDQTKVDIHENNMHHKNSM